MSGAAFPEGLARALSDELGGALLQRVTAGRDLLVLDLRQPGRSRTLALSLEPPGVLLDAGAAPGEADGSLASFRDHLRGALAGARLQGARRLLGGRALALDFDGAPGPATLLVRASEAGAGNAALVRGDTSHAVRRPPAREGDPAAWARAATDDEGEARADLEALSGEVASQRDRLAARSDLHALARELRGAVAAVRRLVARRQDDVGRLGDASAQRALADALAAGLHLVRRGQEIARVTRLDDGTTHDVKLDPRLPPGENLRRAYALAAKAERGAAEAARQLQLARERSAALEGLSLRARDLLAALGDGLPEESDVADVASLVREARALLPRRLERRAAETARARGARAALPEGVRELVSRDGLRILAGRNATSNDALTFRVARGNDVWLHARDVPGPHVVLVVPKGAEIPQESLLDAATVAHVLGDLGGEPRGEVTWCRAKDVRRAKGAGPGRVIVTREKVLNLRVEPERLARLRLRS